MSALPPLPKSPAGSTRSSQRAKQPAAQNATESQIQQAVEDAVRSVRSSQRSVGEGSQRSITSSVALSKLAALENLLLEERRARENAENTLLGLQRERILREEAAKQSEATQKQLNDLLTALRAVVVDPENPTCVRKLQNIIQGKDTPLPSRQATPAGSQQPRAAQSIPQPPPVSGAFTVQEKEAAIASIKKQGKLGSDASSSSNLGRPRHFLDALGQYERARERERQKNKKTEH